MSQLSSGLETLEGLGNAQANSLFDANMQRLDIFSREFVPFTMPGVAQAGVIFGKIEFEYGVLVEAVIFNCFAGAPTTGNLVVEVEAVAGGGTTVIATATLQPADGYYKKVLTNSTVECGTDHALTVKFTSTGDAENPTVMLQVRRRVLAIG